jgi:uncharacterized protein (TIGR02266 family)
MMTMNAVTQSDKRKPRSEATITELECLETAGPRPQRRAHARYAMELDVSLGSDHNFYQGFVENISAGGIFVATHLLKPVGAQVELCVHLPEGGGQVRGVGEVRWIREFNESSDVPPGMGIRFVELEPGSEQAVEQFLTHREPLFFDDE